MKKQTQITAIFVLVVATVAPCVTFAAARTFAELSAQLVGIMNAGAGLLVAAAVAAYFYRMAQNMREIAEGGGQKGKGEMYRKYFFWGILAIFVMISVWGILTLLQNSLFGGNPNAMITSKIWS
jgi:hypothetical protein